MFKHKVSARKFATTKVDQFSGEHTDIVMADESSIESSIEEKKEHVPKE